MNNTEYNLVLAAWIQSRLAKALACDREIHAALIILIKTLKNHKKR